MLTNSIKHIIAYSTRRNYFAERVVNIYNFLPCRPGHVVLYNSNYYIGLHNPVDFSSLRRIIESVDFTDFLKYSFD